MKKIILLLFVWCVVVVVMAQNKISVDVKQHLNRLKAQAENNSVQSGMKTISTNDYEKQTISLIVKVEEGKAPSRKYTFNCLALA